MSVSPKHIDRSCIFRETFESEFAVRKNGGTPTNVLFKDGMISNNAGYIKYKFNYKKIVARSWRFIVNIPYHKGNNNYIFSTNLGGDALTDSIFLNSSTDVMTFSKNYNGTIGSVSNISSYFNKSLEIIVTLNLTMTNVYLNGVIVLSSTGTSTFNYPDFTNINVGNKQNVSSGIKYTLFELYNKVLSPQEVSNLYNKTNYSKLPTTNGDFKEVFRLNPNITGPITDVYGKTLTIVGSPSIKQYGKVKGVYFPGTNSNYINGGNILNTELKDGFIIKTWILPNTLAATSDLIRIDTTNGLEFTNTRLLGVYVNSANRLNSTIALRNKPYLVIGGIYQNLAFLYVFTKTGLIQTTLYATTVTMVKGTTLSIGATSTGTQPYKGFIFDLAIYNGKGFSLNDAFQVYNNEKQMYF